MSTVVISPCNVASYPLGGGHAWVFLQYARGLKNNGCRVIWLEQISAHGTQNHQEMLLSLRRRLASDDIDEILLYTSPSADGPIEFLNLPAGRAEALIASADLLLNFHYSIPPAMLARFRRTALVDIDPGLLQFWVGHGQIALRPHDFHLTTGETVGTPAARFPDIGVNWIQIRPPVALDLWPFTFNPGARALTTVSGWWGGDGQGEWITDRGNTTYENNKRVTFMQFVRLPQLTNQPIELALCLGDGDTTEQKNATHRSQERRRTSLPEDVTTYKSDAEDRRTLEDHGWRVRHAHDVAASPQQYQRYIQQSRGEFSCVKPSCLHFQNAWISDRTLCYLATGKPAIVQHTGPSSYLPSGRGMFRFQTIEEAADAIAQVNTDYRRHCDAARQIAETFFDANAITAQILDRTLTPDRSPR